jgi:hypothetical protein
MARLAAGEMPGFPPEIPNPRRLQPLDRRLEPLWPPWGWLGALVAFLVLEWWLRRSYGMS